MIIAKAPMRVSLVGGSTDFPEFYEKYGGAVVSFAIDKYAAVEIHTRQKDYLIKYSTVEICDTIDEIKNTRISNAIRLFDIKQPLEIVCMADLPISLGLGSSSAFSVAILAALSTYKYGTPLEDKELARLACKLEIDMCKAPIGIQDQWISALGSMHFLEFAKDYNAMEWEMTHAINFINNNGLLFEIGNRNSADSVLRLRKPIADTVGILNNMRKYAITLSVAPIRLAIWASTLNANWELKKELGPVTNSEIDNIINKGIEAGASCAKVNGAGLGGSIFFLANATKHDAIIKALHEYKHIPFSVATRGVEVWM